MKIGILSIKSKTGNEIASKLEVELHRIAFETPQLLIRWGNTKEMETRKVLNKAKAIEKTSDKKLCRELLKKEGIPMAEDITVTPCIARKRHHRGGNGFWYCKTEKERQRAIRGGAVYFTKLYPKNEEYRVHVGGGKCLLVSIKVGDKSRKIRWNKKKGFTFRHMRRSEWLENESLLEMVRVAKRAVEILGLDFGAIDIGYNSSLPQKFVVFEVNTAPALSNLALEKYIEYFKKEYEYS